LLSTIDQILKCVNIKQSLPLKLLIADNNVGTEVSKGQCSSECHPSATCQQVGIEGVGLPQHRCVCDHDLIGDGILSCLPKPQDSITGIA